MKVKVINPFQDKFNLSRTFHPGEVLDFEEGRAKTIVERGLGVLVIEESPKVQKKAEPKAEPVAEPKVKTQDENPEAEAETVKESQSVAATVKKPRKPRQKKTEE